MLIKYNAFAVIRVMPPCFAIGEAVEITAALAVKQGCTPREVAVSAVQKEILARGGYLEL